MKNYEKYADEIRNIESPTIWCDSFTKPKVLTPLGKSCRNTTCGHCTMLTLIWLMEYYEEPEVDWSKVEVDTQILVRHSEKAEWIRRYFAKYENGLVYAWSNGLTSWTAFDNNDDDVTAWSYAKLEESNER